MLSFSRQLCPLQLISFFHDHGMGVAQLLLSYKYDNIMVSCCDKQHFYVLDFLLVANLHSKVQCPLVPTPLVKINLRLSSRSSGERVADQLGRREGRWGCDMGRRRRGWGWGRWRPLVGAGRPDEADPRLQPPHGSVLRPRPAGCPHGARCTSHHSHHTQHRRVHTTWPWTH